jgi:hypothetical protein
LTRPCSQRRILPILPLPDNYEGKTPYILLLPLNSVIIR